MKLKHKTKARKIAELRESNQVLKEECDHLLSELMAARTAIAEAGVIDQTGKIAELNRLLEYKDGEIALRDAALAEHQAITNAVVIQLVMAGGDLILNDDGTRWEIRIDKLNVTEMTEKFEVRAVPLDDGMRLIVQERKEGGTE